MASSAAQKYFGSFTPEQQNQIRASWGGQDLMEEWFENAKRAGAVDDQGNAAGGGQGHNSRQDSSASSQGVEQDYGTSWDPSQGQYNWTQGAGSKPFGSNDYMNSLFDQYVGQGDSPQKAARAVAISIGGLPHDYNPNSTGVGAMESHGITDPAQAAQMYREWEDYRDPQCPPNAPYRSWGPDGMFSRDNEHPCVEKPIDSSSWHMAGGESVLPRGTRATDEHLRKYGMKVGPNGEPVPVNPNAPWLNGGQGPGGAGGGPSTPAEPVTHGSMLSYTGDPMQDMLIYQFNTKATLDGQRKNLFGLGEDRAVGGEGQDADMQKIIGQTLAGGGLWWSGEEDAFGNYNKKGKTNQPKPPSPGAIAGPPPPATDPTTDTTGTTDTTQEPPGPPANMPQYKKDMIEEMMNRRYGNQGGGGGYPY